jgi:general secretion pathway protein D
VKNLSSHATGALAVAILTLIVGCAADRLHSEGLAAVTAGEYETGLAELKKATQSDPGNLAYRIDYETRREQVVQNLIITASSAQRDGDLEAAAGFYRRALGIDPGNDRARRGLKQLEDDARNGSMLAAARADMEHKNYDAAEAKVRAILKDAPGYLPAQELAANIESARGPVMAMPRLKSRGNHKVTLQLRDAPTKMVFEVLQRETGINFVLDKDVKSDSKTSIFVQDVPVEDAIELVLDQNALARQILSDNMVLIYPNIAAKQKDYEQQIVRTFYLTNAAPKDVENLLKTVLGVKTLFVEERSNMVVMRDSPDIVRMAEKLVTSVDIAEPEVMMELQVMEVSRSHVQDLGIQYPGSATLTPTSVAPTAIGGGTAGGLTLYDLGHQTSQTVQVSPLSITLNAMQQAGLVNTLAYPRIRARNNEKAKIHLGSKEPVITNTTTPTAGGTAVVTGSVQYIDVGLQLEVQPVIHPDSEVAIKLSFEVSAILKQITTSSGTIAYEIGTRQASTLLQLRDGETQVLAGLIQDADTHTSNSIPGLGNIPLLSRLFGTHHTDQEKDELLLSITPHIIRMQPQVPSADTEFWFGSESRTRSVPYTSSGAAEPEARSAPSAPTAGTGSASPPAAGQAPAMVAATAMTGAAQAAATAPPPGPQVPPITAPPVVLASNVSSPAAGSARAAEAAHPAAPSALSVDGPTQVKVGDEFPVTVRLASDQSITHLRAQLRFDGSALQLVSADPGDMVPAAAGSPHVETRSGGASLDVVTTADSPVQGNGSLMVLTFKALAPRPTTSVLGMLNVLNGAGAAAGNSQAPPLEIAVLPAQ